MRKSVPKNRIPIKRDPMVMQRQNTQRRNRTGTAEGQRPSVMQVVPPSIEIVFAEHKPASRLQADTEDVIQESIDHEDPPPEAVFVAQQPAPQRTRAVKSKVPVPGSAAEGSTLVFSSSPIKHKPTILRTEKKPIAVSSRAAGDTTPTVPMSTPPRKDRAAASTTSSSSPESGSTLEVLGTGLLVHLFALTGAPQRRRKPSRDSTEELVRIQLTMEPAASELNRLLELPVSPHIVTLLDVRRASAAREYVATLSAPGSVQGTLREWLDRAGPVPVSVAAGAALQITKGLHCLHANGLVHADLRLQNMLVTAEQHTLTIKLLCLGVMNLLSSTSPPLPEDLVGAIGHAPPEQLKGSKLTPASNVWSLGSCLAELITGRAPLCHLPPAVGLHRTLNEPHPPIPKPLEKNAVEFFTSCWSQLPEARSSAVHLMQHPFLKTAGDFCDHTSSSYKSGQQAGAAKATPVVSSRPVRSPENRALKPRVPRKSKPKPPAAHEQPAPPENEPKKRRQPPPVAQMPTSITERYSIQKELGRGSFGVVVLGKNLEDGANYAIKLIHGLATRDQKELALREAKVLKAAKSVHVVQVKEVIEEPNQLLIVMEYASGGVLAQYLESRTVSVEQSRRLIQQILTAVDYLHCYLNIVHRDLKPENILMAELPPKGAHPDQVPVLKLADFGLSTFCKSTKVMTSYCGTPCYLAPEVSKGGGYSRAVDLWSVGVMLHLTVLNKLPPADKGFDPSSVDEHVPAAAVDLITALLAPDPFVRITAKEALQHYFITGEEQDQGRMGLMAMLSDWKFSDDECSPVGSPRRGSKASDGV